MSKFSKMRSNEMKSNLAESFNLWVRIECHHNICVFFIEHIDKVGTLLVDHESQL